MNKDFKFFKQFPETRVTYINKPKNEEWLKWKAYKDCDEKERKEANLRTIFPNEVILDIESLDNIDAIKKQLEIDKFKYLMCKTGSRGIHIHIYFYNLEQYSKDLRNKIREKIIKIYKCDESKKSEDTLIAMLNRPHFKTMLEKEVLEDKSDDDFNIIPKHIMIELREEAERKEEHPKIQIDYNYKDYFETDPLFLELKNRKEIIPEGTRRNDILLKNISIAAAKSGKSEDEFEKIFKPIMERIMPDIPWKQITANGSWYKKALNGELEDYNPFEINKWGNEYLKKPLYDLKPASIVDQLQKKTTPTPASNAQQVERVIFISDKEFETRPEQSIQWLVENWIAAGDICFIAGKASSFKSTIAAHICYCVAENKLVFNKYSVNQCKALYINEENNNKIFTNLVRRVKKGLVLELLRSENVFMSTMENLKIDEIEDIRKIITFVKEKQIKLLVLDSFRRFFIGKENDADVMNRIFETLKFIRRECGDITIIALHHAKKDNQNNGGDIRDILRGSSDIVNSADSVIGVNRKMRSDKLTIEHIKNRSGEEVIGKTLQIDTADNQAYIWETGTLDNNATIASKPEECAEKLMTFLENKQLKIFERKELKEFEEVYKYDTITKAIRILKTDGILTENGNGKRLNYSVNIQPKTVVLEDNSQQVL